MMMRRRRPHFFLPFFFLDFFSSLSGMVPPFSRISFSNLRRQQPLVRQVSIHERRRVSDACMVEVHTDASARAVVDL